MHPLDSDITEAQSMIPDVKGPGLFGISNDARVVKPVTPGIADGLGLSENVQMVAWLDAGKMPIWAIEKSLGLTAGSVMTLRANSEYRELILRCIKVRSESAVVEANGDIDGLFNDQIDKSVATLMEVRDNPFEKGSVRMKAGVEFLDRASKAPKAKREVEERRTIISIPVSELRTMQQALIDEGSKDDMEILELLEGVDFKSDDGGFEVDRNKNGEVEITEVS